MATLTRLYDSREDALSTVQALERAGIGHGEISLIGGNQNGEYVPPGPVASGSPDVASSTADTKEQQVVDAAGGGATAGSIIGAGAGLMAGIGAMAIPGLGPVVAAGWLVAAVTGAGVGAAVGGGTGGLIGSLTSEGVTEADANVYAEGVRRGSYLVSARVEHEHVAEAQRILSSHGVDAATRRTAFEQDGWTRFDESAALSERSAVVPHP